VGSDEPVRHRRHARGQPDRWEAHVGVGEHRHHVRLIDRAHQRHVLEHRQRCLDVATERVDRGIRQPSAVTGEPDRIREVVQRHHRLQPGVARGVHHPPVVVDRGT
jgi:hypothetical protein